MDGQDVFFSLVAAAAIGGMAYYYYMEKKRLDALEKDVGDVYEEQQRYYGESLKEYFDPPPLGPPLGPLYDPFPTKPEYAKPNPWRDYWAWWRHGYSKRYPITERIYKLADLINREMKIEYDESLFLMRLERYMEDYGRDHDLDKARQEDLETYLQQREKDRPPVVRPAVQKGEEGVKPVEPEEEDPVKAEIRKLQEEREVRRKKREQERAEEVKKEQERAEEVKKEQERAEEISKLGQKSTKAPEIKPSSSSSSVPAHTSSSVVPQRRVIYDKDGNPDIYDDLPPEEEGFVSSLLSRYLYDKEDEELERLLAQRKLQKNKIGDSTRVDRTDSVDKAPQ